MRAFGLILLVMAASAHAERQGCAFDDAQLSFKGAPIEQASCLLRPVARAGKIGSAPVTLPDALSSRIGKPVAISKAALRAHLLQRSIQEQDVGGDVTRPVSRARDNARDAPSARYFVIHDTSSPNVCRGEFPANINDPAWGYNRSAAWSGSDAGHLIVGRDGSSFPTPSGGKDFATPWRATRFEKGQIRKKGLFLHVENVQPRKSLVSAGESRPCPNDQIAPDPGMSPAQIERLALVYVAASVRAGTWLIPAYHAVLDVDVGDHDDPQNFHLSAWAKAVADIERAISDSENAQGNSTVPDVAQPVAAAQRDWTYPFMRLEEKHRRGEPGAESCPTEKDLLNPKKGVSAFTGAEAVIIAGIADLVSKRAKEEARVWLVDGLGEKLCRETGREAKYFPNTCAVMKLEDDAAKSTKAILKGIKTDLRYLPSCLHFQQPGGMDEYQGYAFQRALTLWLDSAKRASDELYADLGKLLGIQDQARFTELLKDLAAKLRGNTDGRIDPEDLGVAALGFAAIIDDVQGGGRLKDIRDAIALIEGGDYSLAWPKISEWLECGTSSSSSVCKYAPAMVALGEASNAEEVSAVLDDVVSPVGSWKRKQSEPLLSLSAMVGAHAGKEKLDGGGDELERSSYGLFAPIGVEYTIPLDSFCGSVGGTLSLLDLGAVVSVSDDDDKLAGGEVDSESGSTLSQLASFGVYFHCGIRSTPFKFGIGISESPSLRRIKFSDGTESDVESTRVVAFFAVDVTLFGWNW